ncbi:MAG: phosphate acyltransferase, partial [Pseudomonadota bacterium]
EDERALRCAQNMLQDGVDNPILIGRPAVLQAKLDEMGVNLKAGDDFEVVNPESDSRYRQYWSAYHEKMARAGVSEDLAKAIIRTNTTAIAATAVHLGDADSMICGLFGEYNWHLKYVSDMLGAKAKGALTLLIADSGPLFIADTHVNMDPNPEQIVDCVMAAAAEMRAFKQEPKAAFVANSNFGSGGSGAADKMRAAVALMDGAGADFEYEGEMHADAALDPDLRARIFPSSRLHGPANLLIMSDANSANTAANVMKTIGGALRVGPILLGFEGKAHILTPSATTRGVINMAALAGG